MAKKKSKRFIIPAAFFINTIIEEKLDTPIKNTETFKQPVVSLINEPKTDYASDKKNNLENNNLQESKPSTLSNSLKLNTGVRRKSALSLSSLKRDKIEEAKQKNKQTLAKNLDDLPKDPFTEATFLKVWNNYIEDLHQKGEKIFASILKADIPKIKNNFICVTYPNEMMKIELTKVKSKALKHLRKELNNYSLDFKIDVNEENTKVFAYTPQEKFEFLKNKNKTISTLRKTFNLEL